MSSFEIVRKRELERSLSNYQLKKYSIIMKAKLLLCIVGLFFATLEVSFAQTSGNADSVLNNIQAKVYNAFVSDISTKTNELQKLKMQLATLETSGQNRILVYWRSYLQFYNTILYSQTGKKSDAKEEVNVGIELLNNIPNKSSEDYSLLARLESIALQFAGMNVMNLSKSMNDNIQRGLQLESDNVRANFVYGSIDYYTPAAYGGGKQAEKYLLRAIQLKEKDLVGNYSPTWGKDEAYELLINLYLQNKDAEKAKSLFEEAIKIFPHNYQIMTLREKVYK